MTTAKRCSCTVAAPRQAAGDLVLMLRPPKRWHDSGLETEIDVTPCVVNSAARAESLLQQRKLRFSPAVFAIALAATLMTVIAALISSRCASKGGVYSPSNVIFTAACVVILVLNMMAVGYRSPLLEYLLWKVKQRLHVWLQDERQLAGYLAKLILFQRG